MKSYLFSTLISIILTLLFSGCKSSQTPQIVNPPSSGSKSSFQEEFNLAECTLGPTGSNEYFILDPGFQIVLEGGNEKVIITVLDETILVDGVETRVVEEREWKNEELIETSRNFFAVCEETNDVFYFGEDVEMFSSGILTSHTGEWRAGVDNAKAGLIMPGTPDIGMKYYQEIAPDVAMDRAEILSNEDTLETPAGTFENVVRTQEGTALNLLEKGFKAYAPGIGLIQDANILLTDYGFTDSK